MFGKKKKNEKEIVGKMIAGVPLPDGTAVNVKLTPDVLTINGSSKEFNIDFSKLETLDIKSDVEMEQIIEQSAPGMIIGAAVFGVIGAMIGGRVKTKDKKQVNHFLIINYQSEELKTIILDVTVNWYKAAGMVDYYRKLNSSSTETISVDL